MRILINGLNYAPDFIGVPKYTTEMAEWLAHRGHDIRVVTAPPYYPAWQIHPDYSGLRYRRERRQNVELIRCPLYVPRHPDGAKRPLHLASFAASSFPAVVAEALTFRPQVVFCTAPTLLSAPGALIAARVSKARSWLHIQDFEVDAAFSLGLLTQNYLRRAAKLGEASLLRAFDRVSTISPRMMQTLHDQGCSSEQTYHFRNWVDLREIAPWEGPNSYRQQLELGSDDVLVMYSGNMARKQGLEILIDAAEKLADTSRVHFLLSGDGPAKAGLMARAKALANTSFLELQPAARLGELLGAADIHVLPQLAGASDLVLPSKLSGMLASGRPVIAMAKAGTTLATEVAEAGIATQPEDLDALTEAIQDLARSPARRAALGRCGRLRAASAWSKDIILAEFEQALLSVIEVQTVSRRNNQGVTSLAKGRPKS